VAREEKISRKDLRQPDEFLTLSRRAADWVADNRATVLTVTGGLLVVLIAVVAYQAISASREASAGHAYAAAQALAGEGNYEEAANAFADVVASHGGTEHALLARLQQANALLQAKRVEEAVVAYQGFLDAGPPTDYLRQLAETRLALVNEERGKHAEAVAEYASAAGTSSLFSDDALIGEARTAEAMGDSAKAKELYERFLEDYPASDRRPLVTARLIALGWSPPKKTAEQAPKPADPEAS
jgi:predicted negative regulator of RcsB-dependent stress response